MDPKPTAPTYWDYIRVEELLRLQDGLDDEARLSDDEVRFIVIHQIDELWFKLVLRELATARDLFARVPVPESDLAFAVAALRRVSSIFGLAAQHFALMETMRTQDYLLFRDKLNPASGFQSAQMREIEILLGLEDEERLPLGSEKSFKDALRSGSGGRSPALERVERRLEDRPTLHHGAPPAHHLRVRDDAGREHGPPRGRAAHRPRALDALQDQPHPAQHRDRGNPAPDAG
jgi:tryptophan 2,3-dioxygenase